MSREKKVTVKFRLNKQIPSPDDPGRHLLFTQVTFNRKSNSIKPLFQDGSAIYLTDEELELLEDEKLDTKDISTKEARFIKKLITDVVKYEHAIFGDRFELVGIRERLLFYRSSILQELNRMIFEEMLEVARLVFPDKKEFNIVSSVNPSRGFRFIHLACKAYFPGFEKHYPEDLIRRIFAYAALEHLTADRPSGSDSKYEWIIQGLRIRFEQFLPDFLKEPLAFAKAQSREVLVDFQGVALKPVQLLQVIDALTLQQVKELMASSIEKS